MAVRTAPHRTDGGGLIGGGAHVPDGERVLVIALGTDTAAEVVFAPVGVEGHAAVDFGRRGHLSAAGGLGVPAGKIVAGAGRGWQGITGAAARDRDGGGADLTAVGVEGDGVDDGVISLKVQALGLDHGNAGGQEQHFSGSDSIGAAAAVILVSGPDILLETTADTAHMTMNAVCVTILTGLIEDFALLQNLSLGKVGNVFIMSERHTGVVDNTVCKLNLVQTFDHHSIALIPGGVDRDDLAVEGGLDVIVAIVADYIKVLGALMRVIPVGNLGNFYGVHKPQGGLRSACRHGGGNQAGADQSCHQHGNQLMHLLHMIHLLLNLGPLSFGNYMIRCFVVPFNGVVRDKFRTKSGRGFEVRIRRYVWVNMQNSRYLTIKEIPAVVCMIRMNVMASRSDPEVGGFIRVTRRIR